MFICAMTNPRIVMAAAFMTAAMVFSLTVYALTTKNDLRVEIALLFIIASTMIIFAIMVFFVKSYYVHMIYCGLGVIIFGIYLIIDTKLLLGGKTY